LDHVVLDQRIAGPAVQGEVGVLAVVDAVIAGVVHDARAARVPALAADPVVGAVVPLRAVAPARMQRHRCAARILPERVVVAVVGAGGVVVERLRVHGAGEQAGGAQQRGGGQDATAVVPGHVGSPKMRPRRGPRADGARVRGWFGGRQARGGTRWHAPGGVDPAATGCGSDAATAGGVGLDWSTRHIPPWVYRYGLLRCRACMDLCAGADRHW